MAGVLETSMARTGQTATHRPQPVQRLEQYRHAGTFYGKGTGGADAGAHAALDAALKVAPDGSRHPLHPYALVLEVGKALVDVDLVAAEFQDHHALVLQVDGGLEDIELHVVFLDQLADHRLINDVLGKPEHIDSHVHGHASV